MLMWSVKRLSNALLKAELSALHMRTQAQHKSISRQQSQHELYGAPPNGSAEETRLKEELAQAEKRILALKKQLQGSLDVERHLLESEGTVMKLTKQVRGCFVQFPS